MNVKFAIAAATAAMAVSLLGASAFAQQKVRPPVASSITNARVTSNWVAPVQDLSGLARVSDLQKVAASIPTIPDGICTASNGLCTSKVNGIVDAYYGGSGYILCMSGESRKSTYFVQNKVYGPVREAFYYFGPATYNGSENLASAGPMPEGGQVMVGTLINGGPQYRSYRFWYETDAAAYYNYDEVCPVGSGSALGK